jgi:hypothetical protein
MTYRRILIAGLAAAAVLAIAIAFSIRPAAADGGASPPRQASNEDCLVCHASPDLSMQLPSGQLLELTVSPQEFESSVHGEQGYLCVQCHTDIEGYPHPAPPANTRRGFTISQYRTCAKCHQDKYNATLDSVHQKALAAGNYEAAVCTDCHGVHDIRPAGEPRSQIPQTCRKCHTQIYDLYRESVHGHALIGGGNPDVPSCVDCHGVHDIQGPSTNDRFRLFSPQICARCHADADLMAKYGISTHVFDTYVSDFHGTTVTLFQKVTPDQQTNKPVCIDCHGVHDIDSVEDPNSPVIKQNLVQTCRKCHPDATTNFPAAWMGHYPPSPTHFPLVYYVDLFYKVFIPTVLGGMAVFVVGDASRRIIDRRKRRRKDGAEGESNE